MKKDSFDLQTLFCHWLFLIRNLLKGDIPGLLQLPSDKALVEDPKLKEYVELYAKVGPSGRLYFSEPSSLCCVWYQFAQVSLQIREFWKGLGIRDITKR